MKIRKNDLSSLIVDTLSSGVDTGMDRFGESIELDIAEWLQLKAFASKVNRQETHQWRDSLWTLEASKLDDNFVITCCRVKETLNPEGTRKYMTKKTVNGKPVYHSILSRVTHTFTQNRDRYWLNVIGNPSTIRVGTNTKPSHDFADVEKDLLSQFSLPFETLLTFVGAPLEDLRARIKRGEYTLHNIQFAFYMKTSNKKIVLDLYSGAYAMNTCDDEGARRSFASLLGFSFVDYEQADGKRSGFLLKDKVKDHNVVSLNIYDKDIEGERSGLKESWDKADNDVIDNSLRFDITLHKRFFPQIFTAGFGKGRNSGLRPQAMNLAKAIAAIDKNEGFTTWLVRTILIERFALFSLWAVINPKEDIIKKLETLFDDPKSKMNYKARFQAWLDSDTMTLKEAVEGATSNDNKKISRMHAHDILKKIQKECYISPILTSFYINNVVKYSRELGLKSTHIRKHNLMTDPNSQESDEGIRELLKFGKAKVQNVIQLENTSAQYLLNNIKTYNGALYMQPAGKRRFQFVLRKAG